MSCLVASGHTEAGAYAASKAAINVAHVTQISVICLCDLEHVQSRTYVQHVAVLLCNNNVVTGSRNITMRQYILITLNLLSRCE